jgi:hypothetical protein
LIFHALTLLDPRGGGVVDSATEIAKFRLISVSRDYLTFNKCPSWSFKKK